MTGACATQLNLLVLNLFFDRFLFQFILYKFLCRLDGPSFVFLMDSLSPTLISGGLGFIGSSLGLALANDESPITLIDSLNPNYGGNVRNLEPRPDNSVLRVNISDVRDKYCSSAAA